MISLHSCRNAVIAAILSKMYADCAKMYARVTSRRYIPGLGWKHASASASASGSQAFCENADFQALRLPSIHNSLASASASASSNAVFDGFSLGFGFVIFLRLASASVSASQNFESGFRGSIGVLIKPTITNFVSIYIYLQVTLFASIRSSRSLRLFQ